MDCSFCKRTHDLPMEDGAKGFPINKLMKSLLHMKKTLANAPPSVNLLDNDCNTTLIVDYKTRIFLIWLRAGSCAIDFTQLGHQKCFGNK